MPIAARSAERTSRALAPAVFFDLVALVGLVLVAVGAFVRGAALGLVFLGALAGLAVIPGAVLSAILLNRRARQREWRTTRSVLTIAALAVAAVLVGPVVLVLSWNATPNPAAGLASPFEDQLRAVGGHQLCTNGDPGRGPDNRSAWHEAYYSVPESAPTLQRLQRQARSDGFGDLHRVQNRASSFAESQRFSARRSGSGDRPTDVTVEFSPSGTQLNCEPGYGRTVRPGRDTVVVDLTTTIDPAE